MRNGLSVYKFLLFSTNLLIANMSWSQTIPKDRIVDWTIAGLRDTSTSHFKIIDVNAVGLDANGINPNDALLKSLIENTKEEGIILQFSAGKYLFHHTIHLRSNVIIKGLGHEVTELIFDLQDGGHSIMLNGNGLSGNKYEVKEGIKGRRAIPFYRAYLIFNIFDWIYISHDDADLITSPWASGSIGQIVQITDVDEDSIYLNSDLRFSFTLNRNPHIQKLDLQGNTGIECLKIVRKDNTSPVQTSNIHLLYTENVWVRGVELDHCTFAHIDVRRSSNISIHGCYIHHGFEYGAGGRAYGVVLQLASNECRVENNIFQNLRHSMLLQAGANGNVFAYNYSFDPYWENENTFLPTDAAGEMVLHGNYPYFNLFEQNICRNIVIDNSHGANGPGNTFFRNRAEGYGIFFSAENSPGQNIIGNEITNMSLPYHLVNYTIQGEDQFVYGNNNKGHIDPKGTEYLPDESYGYTIKPDFVPESLWARIGTPYFPGQSSIPSKIRYHAGNPVEAICTQSTSSFDSKKMDRDHTNISVFPNPGINHLVIQNTGLHTDVEYNIFNGEGRLIKKGQMKKDGLLIDVSNWPSGLYFLSFQTSNVRVFRWIKL